MNKRTLSSLLILILALTLLTAAVAAEEPAAQALRDGLTPETAIPMTPGVEMTIDLTQSSKLYYSFSTTKVGQFFRFLPQNAVSANAVQVRLYKQMDYEYEDVTGGWLTTDLVGTQVLVFERNYNYKNRIIKGSLQIVNNDANEPNLTPEQATPLTLDVAVPFVLDNSGPNYEGRDVDTFSFTTTQPNQIVALTFTGLPKGLYGGLRMTIDGDGYTASTVTADKTLTYCVEEPGIHYLRIQGVRRSDWRNEDDYQVFTDLKVQMTVQKGNENGSKETAACLPIGTDASFSLPAIGSESWYRVSSPGGTDAMYTLNLMDFQTDYSDKILYDVMAPDGSVILNDVSVSIRHTRQLLLNQQGEYYIRLFCPSGKTMSNPLRIRVDLGCDDPNEFNDTWKDAKEAPIGQPISFILSNTNDQDWFQFTVPEPYMTLSLSPDCYVYWELYTADQLPILEQNGYVEPVWRGSVNGKLAYHQLAEAGTYYICLTVGSGYISTDLHNMTISLEAPTAEEPNNTWKTAKPIYEGVPQQITISAHNDEDWFSFTVPEGKSYLRYDWAYDSSDIVDLSFYRQQDFLNLGDSAPACDVTKALEPGVYYVCPRFSWSGTNTSRATGTLTIHLSDQGNGATMGTAMPLEPGAWAAFSNVEDSIYIDLGWLEANTVVRALLDSDSYLSSDAYVVDENGSAVSGWNDHTTNQTSHRITTAGQYYLRIRPYSPVSFRVSYDICKEAAEIPDISGPDSITLTVGQTMYLDYRATSLGNSSTSVPEVSISAWSPCVGVAYGRITGKAVGAAQLQFSVYDSTGSHITKDVSVNVVESLPITGISISGAPVSLSVGSAAQLTADVNLSVSDASPAVTWSVNDPALAYVDQTGRLTGLQTGTVTVTARCGDVWATAAVQITAAPVVIPVSGIKLNCYEHTMRLNDAPPALTATLQPAGAAGKITWKSSNAAVASVSDTGVLTVHGTGTALISAACGDYKASCMLTVLPVAIPVESLAFPMTFLNLPMDSTYTLTPILSPAEATERALTYASADISVATVSASGVITTHRVGTTTITATTADGKLTARLTLTVKATVKTGDLSGDGLINSADAMLILNHVVGNKVLTAQQLALADVNKDGAVNVADAIRILRFSVNLIDKL